MHHVSEIFNNGQESPKAAMRWQDFWGEKVVVVPGHLRSASGALHAAGVPISQLQGSDTGKAWRMASHTTSD